MLYIIQMDMCKCFIASAKNNNRQTLRHEWLPQYKSEIQALIDFELSYENGSSVVDSLRNKFDEEKLKF